jgi:hypothetical protein
VTALEVGLLAGENLLEIPAGVFMQLTVQHSPSLYFWLRSSLSYYHVVGWR